MLVNLVPEFLAVLAAPDPPAAYHEYLDRHGPVLGSYWHNYVLDPSSPHAEQVIAAALRADRADLKRLLADVDVVSIAEDALQRALDRFEADCPVDLYLMVGVGAANAGELVVGGRGIAFLCLEHFTGRANPQTYGMGLPASPAPVGRARDGARRAVHIAHQPGRPAAAGRRPAGPLRLLGHGEPSKLARAAGQRRRGRRRGAGGRPRARAAGGPRGYAPTGTAATGGC